MQIHELPTISGSPSGGYFATDNGTQTTKIDYTALAQAIIEQYNASTLAGSAQSVKAALDGLDAGRFFSGGTVIASGTDLNTLTTPGVYWYRKPITQLVNYPNVSDPGDYMTLYVFYRAIETRMYQVLYSTMGTWYRCQQNATNWYAWKRLDNNEDAVDYLYLGPNDTSIPADSDLNDYRTAGTFVVNAGSQMATMANVPVSDIGGRLDVRYILKTNAADADSAKRLFQIFTGNNPNYPRWVRFYNGSTWFPWQKLPTRAEVDALNSKLTVNGVLRLSDSASVKPLTLTVPNTSRHLLILTGPYVSRGHAVYTVSCNASGNCYAFLIGGGDDMPTKVSGTGNTLTITSTSGSDTIVAVADLVIYGNQMTIAS